MDNLIIGRTFNLDVEITPSVADLTTSQVSFKLNQGQTNYIDIEASSVSDSVASFILDDTSTLEEGLYTYEVVYSHNGLEDSIISGIINVIRRA